MAAEQSRGWFRRASGAAPVAEDPPVPEFDFPDRDGPVAASAPPADVPPAESPPEPAPVGPADRDTVTEPGDGFLSPRPPRRHVESVFVRVVATAGIVGIATAVGAVMGSLDVTGWLIGLVVSLLSVTLAALLWRSRIL